MTSALLTTAGIMSLATLIVGLVRKRATNRRDAAWEGPEDREVSILILGEKESGKTVLLAAMWRQLRIGRKSVRLTVDHDGQKRKLQQLIEQIENLKADSFPASTSSGEAAEYKFTAQALDRAGRPTNTVKVSYFDYPGEEITKLSGTAQGPVLPTLRNALQDAHVILGIIDGHKVAKAMKNEPDDDYYITLGHITTLMAAQIDKTVHIVITKWDLLQGYRLEDVIAKLKEYEQLRDLLELPRFGGIRFIPVAALGVNGFVRRAHREDGTEIITKDRAKAWKPVHVLAPLACAIPDVLRTDVSKLETEERQKTKQLVVAPGEVSHVFVWVTLWLGLSMIPGLGGQVPGAIREIVMKVSLDKVLDRFFRIVLHPRVRRVPASDTARSALLRTLAVFKGEEQALEQAFPAARLIATVGMDG